MKTLDLARLAPLAIPHTLSKTGWLSRQPDEFRERMASIGRWRNFRAGQNLYESGDEADAVFGLEMGLLDISIPVSDDLMVHMHRAGPGFWIGDSALLAEQPRVVSVHAHVDSLVFAIPAAPLRRLLAQRPQDLLYFYRLNHANIALVLQGYAEVLALPPRVRFARMLLRLAAPDGLIQATQSELGGMVGMSRAAFRRALCGLIAAGIVRTEYCKVWIVDRAGLEDAAAGF